MPDAEVVDERRHSRELGHVVGNAYFGGSSDLRGNRGFNGHRRSHGQPLGGGIEATITPTTSICPGPERNPGGLFRRCFTRALARRNPSFPSFLRRNRLEPIE